MIRSLLLLSICSFFKISAQIVTTVAGSTPAGYAGDGGPATAAQLNTVEQIALDSAGNLYISDLGNYAVRRVSTAGIITTYAGGNGGGNTGDGGLASAAQLYQPRGMAFDKYNNLYICDSWNNVVRKVDAATGIISLFAGNYTAGFGGDGGPATSAMLFDPLAMAFDTAGNAYIVENQNYRVRKVNTSGIISTFAGAGVANFGGDGGPATSAWINYPTAIAIDDTGNVYIGDDGNNRIRRVDYGSGTIQTILGNGTAGFAGDGGPATAAQVDGISQLTFDKHGNLYIADYYNHVIRMIDQSGIINTIAGDGSAISSLDGALALATGISYPKGIVIDDLDNYYFSEYGSDLVRHVCVAPDSVSGMVTEPNASPVTSGQVFVYKQNLTHSGYLDTAGYANINPDGTYAFGALPHGNYFVEVIASALYPNAITSYYSSHANNYIWDSATIVTHYGCKSASNTGYNITITEITPMTGTGTVSGNVIANGGYGQRSGTIGTMGAPLKGVDVKLGRNPSGIAAARTTTDISGNYSFTNVDTGSYFVFVDIPNFRRDTLWAPHLTSLAPNSAGDDYCVDSILVNPCSFTTGLHDASAQALSVYPNPASDAVYIPAGDGELVIINSMGLAVRTTRLTEHAQPIDVRDLPSGVYVIRTDRKQFKFVKH